MVDLVTLQATAYVAQVVGVVGTLTAAFIAVRSYINANKRAEDAKRKEQETRELELKAQQQNLETRQAQLFMNIYQATFAQEFEKACVEVLMNTRLKSLDEYISMINGPNGVGFSIYGMWLEGQGVLVREGLIDIRLVAELIGGLVVMWWSLFGPFVQEYRKVNNPRHFVEAEYLYRRIVDYGSDHPELLIPSLETYNA